MPGVYTLKLHAYSPVTLLLISCMFGFTIKAQASTRCEQCYNITACPRDGDCQLCPSTCPEGFYSAPDTECTISTPSTPTTTLTPFVTGNTNNTTTIANVSSATGALLTPGTNLSTSTQSTTVNKLITCKKCFDANCRTCSNYTSCENCNKDYALTAASTCEVTRVDDNSALIGGVVGGVLGGLLVIGIIVFVIVWWRRRRQTQGMNSSTAEQQQPQNQETEQPHKKPKQLPKLTDDVVNMHDRILRYTSDPTSKRFTTSSSPEEEEIEELPAAPPPPPQNKTYDQVRSSQNYTASYTEFKHQTTQEHQPRLSAPPPPSQEEEIYANQESIAQAQDEADGLYANTQTLKSERQQFKVQTHGSSSSNIVRSGSRAKKDDVEMQQAQPTAEEKVVNAGAEQEDIYTNDSVELIAAGEDEKETQEIYLNENLEEDIYLNVMK